MQPSFLLPEQKDIILSGMHKHLQPFSFFPFSLSVIFILHKTNNGCYELKRNFNFSFGIYWWLSAGTHSCLAIMAGGKSSKLRKPDNYHYCFTQLRISDESYGHIYSSVIKYVELTAKLLPIMLFRSTGWVVIPRRSRVNWRTSTDSKLWTRGDEALESWRHVLRCDLCWCWYFTFFSLNIYCFLYFVCVFFLLWLLIGRLDMLVGIFILMQR